MQEHQKDIYKFGENLKHVLVHGGSINNDSRDLWTSTNFKHLSDAVNKNLKEGEGTFLLKIKEQLREAKESLKLNDESYRELCCLMVEILSLYYVFPSNISSLRKEEALKELISVLDLDESEFSLSFSSLKSGGIGSGGMGFNTNKQKEIFYLIDVFNIWFDLKEQDRTKEYLDINNELGLSFQNFLDNDDVADGRSPQSRHVLLHLLAPDYYEPIISTGQKKRISQVFSFFCNESDLKKECERFNPKNTIDQELKVIGENLAKLKGLQRISFYHEDFISLWDSTSASIFPDLDTELLDYKKQVVLYGPPGTSKTFNAKLLAREIIRYKIAKDMGAKVLAEEGSSKLKNALDNNIHRLQLHPAYSYEEFVRGLKLNEGKTEYKNGYLLNLIDKMKKNPDDPHVLILDEINRVDLSRLFGECFSALENRGEKIDLLGSDNEEVSQLVIPNNLYIIGTMNLIDHSIEQLDFALRRRFLWVEANYNENALLQICDEKWKIKSSADSRIPRWEVVENDFNKLIYAANKLNLAIENEPELGKDFKLGHVFFIDVVEFLVQFLGQYDKNPRAYLFSHTGKWREPIDKLWRLSLYPLLKEYLSGLDNKSQETIIKKLQESFKP